MINHRTTAAFRILMNSTYGYGQLLGASPGYAERWAIQKVETDFREHGNPVDVTQLLKHMKILFAGGFNEKSFKMKLALKGIETKITSQTTKSIR